jgi:hypothetical protein
MESSQLDERGKLQKGPLDFKMAPRHLKARPFYGEKLSPVSDGLAPGAN